MTGTLEHLDPATLLIGDNVRDHASLDKQFVTSVREHGVLQPITAIRTDGGIEVRDGQRRTMAAREAQLASIPVYVLDADTDNTPVAAAERIAVQIVANDQRTALTDAQRAKGITQMLLAGVSPAKVAKILRTKNLGYEAERLGRTSFSRSPLIAYLQIPGLCGSWPQVKPIVTCIRRGSERPALLDISTTRLRHHQASGRSCCETRHETGRPGVTGGEVASDKHASGCG
jgi:hypothetical protein